jgi:hypothetical protein
MLYNKEALYRLHIEMITTSVFSYLNKEHKSYGSYGWDGSLMSWQPYYD